MTEVKKPTLEALFEALSKKLDIPVADLKAEFEEVRKEVAADPTYQNATPEQIEVMTRNKFGMRKQREMGSTAIPWEGVILGVGDLIDTVAAQKKATSASFIADPMKTIKGCMFANKIVLSDEKGTPLYPKTDANDKFKRSGKPLPEHSWLRTIYGVARPIDPKTKQVGPPKPFTMSINNEPAIDAKKIPMNKTVKFKGINKTNEEDNKIGFYRINHSSFTKFDEATIADMPSIETFYQSIPSHYKPLVELDEYQTEHEDDRGRWIITEGNVVNMNLEPNAKTSNMMMTIWDEPMMFAGEDKRPITCWIPTDRNVEIDFGVDSRVYVLGRTARGKARDPITGLTLEGVPGDVMINIYGVFAPLMFKVAPPVKPVTEAAMTPKNW